MNARCGMEVSVFKDQLGCGNVENSWRRLKAECSELRGVEVLACSKKLTNEA